MNTLFNSPSIAVWVPFNESWGQFDSLEVAEFVKSEDHTRLIDHASGWFDQGGGDFFSKHLYVQNLSEFVPGENQRDRVYVVSEGGGFSLSIEGHIFNPQKAYGYFRYKSLKDFEDAFIRLYKEEVIPSIHHGLSAFVYTQLSDIEDKINGLVTYDRKFVKLSIEKANEINQKVVI